MMQISEYGQLAGAVRGGGMQGDKAEEGGRAESWWACESEAGIQI